MDKMDIYRELLRFRRDAHTAISSEYIGIRELRKFHMVLESEYDRYQSETHPPIVGLLKEIKIQLREIEGKIELLQGDDPR